MATCEKRVEGQIMSYPCTLEAGHERIGAIVDDPEPCMTTEVERSVRVHDQWVARMWARAEGRAETVDDIVEQTEEAMAAHDVAEPEHNLRASNCMMRPIEGPEVASDPGEYCQTCRPAVLIENDEAIRSGQIHNPFDPNCEKRSEGDRSIAFEVCYICRGLVASPATVASDQQTQSSEALSEIDRNARAYGYEVGKGHPVAEVIEETSPDNPFMDPDWREKIAADAEGDDERRVIEGVVSFEEMEVTQRVKALTTCPLKDCDYRAPHSHGTDSPGVSVEEYNEAVRLISQLRQQKGYAELAQAIEAEHVAHAEASRPTKQRDGDQILPKRGDRVVQDWMIDREMAKGDGIEPGGGVLDPDAEMVVEAMEESQRVGIERYGQALHTFDGRLNIRDLAEELRDAFVYVSKLQMTAEADRETLVRMVAQAIEAEFISGGESDTRGFYAEGIAEVAVDKILDWVLTQRLGPDQVRPVD